MIIINNITWAYKRFLCGDHLAANCIPFYFLFRHQYKFVFRTPTRTQTSVYIFLEFMPKKQPWASWRKEVADRMFIGARRRIHSPHSKAWLSEWGQNDVPPPLMGHRAQKSVKVISGGCERVHGNNVHMQPSRSFREQFRGHDCIIAYNERNIYIFSNQPTPRPPKMITLYMSASIFCFPFKRFIYFIDNFCPIFWYIF